MSTGAESVDDIIASLALPERTVRDAAELPVPDNSPAILEKATTFLAALNGMLGTEVNPLVSVELPIINEPHTEKVEPTVQAQTYTVDPKTVAFLVARSKAEHRLLEREAASAERLIKIIEMDDVDIIRVLEIGPNDIPRNERLQVSPVNAKCVVASNLAARYNFMVAPDDLKIRYHAQAGCPTLPVGWDPKTGIVFFYKKTMHNHHRPTTDERASILKVYGLTPYMERYGDGYVSWWHSLIAMRPDRPSATMRTLPDEEFASSVKEQIVIMAARYKQWRLGR